MPIGMKVKSPGTYSVEWFVGLTMALDHPGKWQHVCFCDNMGQARNRMRVVRCFLQSLRDYPHYRPGITLRMSKGELELRRDEDVKMGLTSIEVRFVLPTTTVESLAQHALEISAKNSQNPIDN
ncbi:hypothetical protein [Bacteriophage sp.]|nr:hypothetical protein [Bacteriophage sp.]